jgi:hypothetical protein
MLTVDLPPHVHAIDVVLHARNAYSACIAGKMIGRCTLLAHTQSHTLTATLVLYSFTIIRLLEAGCPYDAASVSHASVNSGNVQMVKFLKQQQGVAVGATAMQAAAKAGHTAVCQYLLSAGTCII